MVELVCDADHIIHLAGSDDYTEMRRITLPPDEADRYEEIAVADIPPYTKAEYDAKVAGLIRERYTADEEDAIKSKLLYALLHPEAVTLDETGDAGSTPKEVRQFEEFWAYRTECLAIAKDPGLYRKKEQPDIEG